MLPGAFAFTAGDFSRTEETHMAWLFVFLFGILVVVLAFLLFEAIRERTRGKAAIALRDDQIAAANIELAAKASLQADRDKAVAAYAALREKAKALLDAEAKAKQSLQAAHEQQIAALRAETKALLDNEASLKQSLQADRERLDAMLRACEQNTSSLSLSRAEITAERDSLTARIEALTARFRDVVDADREHERIVAMTSEARATYNAEKQRFESDLAAINTELIALRAEHKALSEEAALAEMGFYKSKYGFASSERYRKAIEENSKQQKEMLSDKIAAVCSVPWTIDGSFEKGKKQTDKMLSLMLRAFNGECDSAIAKVKPTNFQTMENRIQKAFDAINKMGEMQSCRISEAYKLLRMDELRLEHEHSLKVQAEREQQRAIKEEMRQQAIAEKELERAQQEAEREERQYEAALAKAKEDFEKASATKQEEMRARLAELEQMVAEAHANKERAISRAQQTRSGHVYVISNIGSFGMNVYKIGMTRRLDPMDRIWELSDASVPFDFDVHAIIYTDDAPSLETELHQRFANKRVNVVNQKKEFFHVTIDEITAIVRERFGDIELTLAAEAVEFRQSDAFYRENGRSMADLRQFSPAAPTA